MLRTLLRSNINGIKYARVEYCSRCDFQKEFERLEREVKTRDKSILIQGIKTTLRTGKFQVSLCTDGSNWTDLYSGLAKGKPEKSTVIELAQSIHEKL